MTICIAALAAHGNELVLVSDSKVALGGYSADHAAMKHMPLFENYAIMFAGNDVAHFGSIFNRSVKRLKDSGTKDPDETAEVVFEELQAERDRISEAQILRPHLFDIQTFRAKGKDICTDSIFYDIHSRLEYTTLSLDVLIAGFDENKEAHIRFINSTTPPQNHDNWGFWAIGSGAEAALGSLFHAVEYLSLSKYADVEEAVYHVMAAKFIAEAATDVGRDTFLATIRIGRKAHFLHVFCGDEYVRNQWKEKGAPRVPKGITDAIKDLLCPIENTAKPETLARIQKYSKSARGIIKSMERAKQSGAEKSEPEQ